MRATGLQQGDPSAEIIDLLDEDSDAFPGRASTSGHDDDGRWRHWLAPMSGLAIVGLIGYAIASSSSTHPASTATSTTALATAPATTAPHGSPVALVPADVHYYAADAASYSLLSASVASGLDTEADHTSYQRWTAAGDPAPAGSWFSIETYPAGGTDPADTINAYRVDLNGRYIAVSYPAFKTIAADFSASPTLDVHLLGVGLSDGQVLQLVGAVAAQDGNVILADANAYAGYERSTTVSPTFAIARTPIVQADYADGEAGHRFSLTVGRIDPGFDGGVQLSDRSSALRHSLIHTTSFTIDGHGAVAGEEVDRTGTSLATWMVGDDVITLYGSVPTAELISIARTVHEVTAIDWQRMILFAAQHVSLASQSNPLLHEGAFKTVATGQFSTGEAWSIQAAWTTRGDQTYVSWMWPGPDDGNTTMLMTSDVAQLTDELDNGRTFMLAALPRTYDITGATLHIDRPGMEPIAVPFNDLGPEFDRTLAAYAFIEPGMFTAWIETADGSILASWPS